MQDGNNINLKTAGPNELNHSTRIPANQVSFPDESHFRKGNMEKKDDIIQDDYEQTQVMLVEENQNSADEDLVVDVLTNLKELVSQSTPVLWTHNAHLENASKSKVCKTTCKRERSPSGKEALDNPIAKCPKYEAGSSKASTSKQGRRSWHLKKSSRAYRLVREFGHTLMGYVIRVWWPEEQTFFEGSITEFDQKTKRHRIDYVDGDVEILDLTKECWNFADIENLNPILELETYQGPPPPPKRGGKGKRKR